MIWRNCLRQILLPPGVESFMARAGGCDGAAPGTEEMMNLLIIFAGIETILLISNFVLLLGILDLVQRRMMRPY
jgi:hypothetical protein